MNTPPKLNQITPQQLRVDAWRIQQVCRDARHAEHGICEPCFAMVQRIRLVADHLEQSREQPAVHGDNK